MIHYQSHLNDVDWEALRQDLIEDDFHNGRSTDQLRLSFENSAVVALGYDGDRCIANGRLISDGVGNAYVVDVWTHSDYRRQGIGRQIMEMLITAVPGQHIYLQSDDNVDFYKKLGFTEQPQGLSLISGNYLQNETRQAKPVISVEPIHKGSCHCGRVQFEVTLPHGLEDPRRCDCSFCRRRGAIAASVTLDNLKIISGEEFLTLYQFKTMTAQHYFCSICGIYTHHQRRSNPSQYGFNVACLDGVNPFDLGEVPVYDGVNHPKDQ